MFFTDMKQGKVQAIYTGRFAYVLGRNADESLNDFESVVENNEIDCVELVEEYNHFKLFSKSVSALYINGLRWFVRILFNLFNSEWLVYDYYKARVIFFGLSYEFHEKNVLNFQDSYFKLLKLDLLVICHSIFRSRVYLLFLIIFPFVVFVGFVISFHFALRVRDHSSDEPKEINISKFGYVGIKKDQSQSSALARFGVLIQVETYLNKGDKIKWLLAKFRAEKEMWSLYEKTFKFGVLNTYEEYTHQFVRFVDLWFGGGSGTRKYKLELFRSPSFDKYIELKDNLTDLERDIWFVYSHGN